MNSSDESEIQSCMHPTRPFPDLGRYVPLRMGDCSPTKCLIVPATNRHSHRNQSASRNIRRCT